MTPQHRPGKAAQPPDPEVGEHGVFRPEGPAPGQGYAFLLGQGLISCFFACLLTSCCPLAALCNTR